MGFEEAEDKNSATFKKTQPSFVKNLSFYLTEYCDNTSIHGLKFFGERRRYIIEKIWWLIVVGASLYFCTNLMWQTYQKWMTAPVIVSFATSETPLFKVPFPAVSICPLIKTEKAKFDFETVLNWREAHIELDEETTTKFRYMSLVCPKALEAILDGNETATADAGVNSFLIKMSPQFNKTIYKCSWLGKDCTNRTDEIFTPVLTSIGVCYTFNMLDRNEIFTNFTSLDYYKNLSIKHQPSSEWTLEQGYSDKSQLKSFPRRTILTGTVGGLELIFYTADDDIDRVCEESLKGYKVILHHPGEIPRSHQNYFWVPLNQLVSVSVKPNMITTSEKLRSYEPEARKCCFEGEKNLRFFKSYNQQNCLLECLSNYTYQTCHCVGFYMPRVNSMPICGPAKVTCLYDANVEFLAREARFQMNAEKKKKKDAKAKTRKPKCNCLPSCTSLHFDAETSQLNWDWREGKLWRQEVDNKTVHLSRLRIFFKDLQFMTSERNELYGQTEFWANCGGLLGLFTGFSFISVAEILYYTTLRFACNVKKYGLGYWSGAQELLEVKVNT